MDVEQIKREWVMAAPRVYTHRAFPKERIQVVTWPRAEGGDPVVLVHPETYTSREDAIAELIDDARMAFWRMVGVDEQQQT